MMKKLFALLVAGVDASTAFAQEAPDVLVQRVTEEVLEIIRNELDVTMAFCGHTRLTEVDRRILLPGSY